MAAADDWCVWECGGGGGGTPLNDLVLGPAGGGIRQICLLYCQNIIT